MIKQVEWERHNKETDYKALDTRAKLRAAAQAKADAEDKAATGVLPTHARAQQNAGSGLTGGGGGSSGSGKAGGGGATYPAAGVRPSSTTAPATQSTPGTKLPCVTELLYQLQFGNKCRNASTNCKFEHFQSYKDCINTGTRDRKALKQYILTHPIVTAKGSNDQKFVPRLSAKIDTI